MGAWFFGRREGVHCRWNIQCETKPMQKDEFSLLDTKGSHRRLIYIFREANKANNTSKHIQGGVQIIKKIKHEFWLSWSEKGQERSDSS